MKKLLIIFLVLSLITGCSKKQVLWTDVQENFESVMTEVNDITSKMETIVRDDYKGLLTELKDYVNDAKYDVEEDNQDLLKRAYKVAYYIEKLASRAKSEYADELLNISKEVKNLCKGAFEEEKEEEFYTIKVNIIDAINNCLNWQDKQWAKVEVLEKIKWADVEEEILQIENTAWYDTKTNEEVSEYDLDDLKHVILDNYELIEDGITENNDEIAKEIYYAAVQLESYSRRIYNAESNKVKEFALASQSYVKQMYDKTLEDWEVLEKDYVEYANDASKWTQSTWNEIIAYLRVPEPVE